MEIKPFTNDDIPFAVEQARREGWATGRSYFELHLQHDPGGAFLAWEGTRRVGMITATKFTASGWLGNLIVDPEFRSRGIGRKLMTTAFDYLRDTGTGTIRLDADPPGIPLYRSMGFVGEYESSRFSWKGRAGTQSDSVRPFTRKDLPAAAELDSRCFGDNRRHMLELMLDQVRDAFVTTSGDRMSGFLYLIQSSSGLRVGPCCAESIDDARNLITTVLAGSNGATVGLGIPEPNRHGCELLVSLGFVATPPCLRMLWGDKRAVGDHESYFAIAGGAVG